MFYHTTACGPSGRGKKPEKKTESKTEVLKRRWGGFIDRLVCIVMIIITVVLPFYFKKGYGYIATDKNLFFRQAVMIMGTILIPAAAVYLILTGIAFFQRKEKGERAVRKGPDPGKAGFAADCFAGLYGLALMVSYLCSDYREHALWGSEGWYMGFFTQMALLCVYFLISRFWKPRESYFYLILAVSGAVFMLGYLNRFGIYPVEMEMSNPGFISTIGNINWYCGYAVTVFFPGAAFLWQGGGKGRGQTILLTLYVWLGFAALVTQGSASGIMTLAAVMLLLFVLSAGESGRMCRFWMLAFLLGAACLFTEILTMLPAFEVNLSDALMNLLITGPAPIIMTVVSFLAWQWMRRRAGASDDAGQKGRVFRKKGRIAAIIVVTAVSFALAAFAALIILNTLRPGSIGGLSRYGIFTFSDDWGSKRGATWKAGVRCFSEQDLLHKLTGVGPDAMEAFLYRDGSRELTESLREAFGSNRLTNAHNEWLTVLVNTGIPGLAGFGGMMVSAMLCFRKRGEKNPVAGSCGVALFAYTVNNIFSFQQIMNITQVYVLLGMGMAFLRAEQVRE